MTEELLPGWEIVSRRTPFRLGRYLALLVQSLITFQPPANAAPVVFTLRNQDSGETRQVTASSIEEAQLRVAQGKFDR